MSKAKPPRRYLLSTPLATFAEYCQEHGLPAYRAKQVFQWIYEKGATRFDEMTNLAKLLRTELADKYSKRTIGKGLYEEIRFVINAYLERNFRKLELLNLTSDERLYRRRYARFSPLVLSAMIYDFCAAEEAHLFQVGEMAATPGSPPVVFGLDAVSFREQVEGLHDRGWLRYETTHNLDQIRIRPEFSAIEFLTAYYEDREPCEATKQSTGDVAK